MVSGGRLGWRHVTWASGQAQGFRSGARSQRDKVEGRPTRQAGLDLRAAGMKAMAGAAMATRVAAKNFMVEECEVCGWVGSGEGGR